MFDSYFSNIYYIINREVGNEKSSSIIETARKLVSRYGLYINNIDIQLLFKLLHNHRMLLTNVFPYEISINIFNIS